MSFQELGHAVVFLFSVNIIPNLDLTSYCRMDVARAISLLSSYLLLGMTCYDNLQVMHPSHGKFEG